MLTSDRMKGPTAAGVSIWLVPTGEVYERFDALISSLSRRCGTPPFEPHVTLLGGLSGPEAAVLSRAEQLSGSLAPLEIRPTTAGHRDEYFRCLFVQAEPTPALVAAHARAAELFERREEPFFPHLSLIYGDLAAEEKERILDEVGRDLATAFDVGELHAVRTEGEVRSWRRLASYPLGRV